MTRTLGLLAATALAATAIGHAAPAWSVPGEVLDGTYTLISKRDGGTLDTWIISPQCSDEQPYLGCKASVRMASDQRLNGTAEYVGGYDWHMVIGNGNCGISAGWNGKTLTGEVAIAPCGGASGGGVFPFRMVKQ